MHCLNVLACMLILNICPREAFEWKTVLTVAWAEMSSRALWHYIKFSRHLFCKVCYMGKKFQCFPQHSSVVSLGTTFLQLHNLLLQSSQRKRLSDSNVKHQKSLKCSIHVNGHIYLRWVVLLVAKRLVAVGCFYSSTMLCFMLTYRAASSNREQTDHYHTAGKTLTRHMSLIQPQIKKQKNKQKKNPTTFP